MNAIDLIRMLPTSEKKKILSMLQSEVGQQEPPKETIIPIAEVAKRLHRSKRAVHLVIKAGLLKPFVPKGRKRSWGVYASSLDAFFAGGKVGDV